MENNDQPNIGKKKKTEIFFFAKIILHVKHLTQKKYFTSNQTEPSAYHLSISTKVGIQVLGIYAFQIGFESLTVCPLKKLESQKRTSHCCAEGVLVIFLGGFITWKCVCSIV